MNSLYISYCSVVKLRLLALEMLFLSAASRLQKQSSSSSSTFPSSLHSPLSLSLLCPGYKGGSEWWFQLRGSDQTPVGSGLQRIPRRTTTLCASFNPPSPRLSQSHYADSGPTALLTLCDTQGAVLYVHISAPPFPR